MFDRPGMIQEGIIACSSFIEMTWQGDGKGEILFAELFHSLLSLDDVLNVGDQSYWKQALLML